MMKELVNRIRRDHKWEAPHPRTEQLIRQFDLSSGYRLPADIVQFYLLCGGANLFEDRYRIMHLDELRKASMVPVRDNTDDYCPSCWLAICDVMDGNYVGINLIPQDDSSFQILGLDHENIGECGIIARSFSEFLERALNSNGALFYLQPDFAVYGTLKYENPPSFSRRIDAHWYESLGPEVGPENCKVAGCGCLRIRFSVMCRRHHYEQVWRRPCPFDE